MLEKPLRMMRITASSSEKWAGSQSRGEERDFDASWPLCRSREKKRSQREYVKEESGSRKLEKEGLDTTPSSSSPDTRRPWPNFRLRRKIGSVIGARLCG